MNGVCVIILILFFLYLTVFSAIPNSNHTTRSNKTMKMNHPKQKSRAKRLSYSELINMDFLFKVWSSNRENKTFIVLADEHDLYVNLILKASERLNTGGSKLVLESDGTLIDDDQILKMLNKETFILLSKADNWMPIIQMLNLPTCSTDTLLSSPLPSMRFSPSPPARSESSSSRSSDDPIFHNVTGVDTAVPSRVSQTTWEEFEEWPILLIKEVTFWHFEKLMALKISELESMFIQRENKILQFGIERKFTQVKTIPNNENEKHENCPHVIGDYFKENIQLFIKKVDDNADVQPGIKSLSIIIKTIDSGSNNQSNKYCTFFKKQN